MVPAWDGSAPGARCRPSRPGDRPAQGRAVRPERASGTFAGGSAGRTLQGAGSRRPGAHVRPHGSVAGTGRGPRHRARGGAEGPAGDRARCDPRPAPPARPAPCLPGTDTAHDRACGPPAGPSATRRSPLRRPPRPARPSAPGPGPGRMRDGLRVPAPRRPARPPGRTGQGGTGSRRRASAGHGRRRPGGPGLPHRTTEVARPAGRPPVHRARRRAGATTSWPGAHTAPLPRSALAPTDPSRGARSPGRGRRSRPAGDGGARPVPCPALLAAGPHDEHRR